MQSKKVTLRQCIGCRENKVKKSMIRIVKTPEDEILLDETGKMNGRGAYLCKELECLKKAIKFGGISRSLKVFVSEEVYKELERELM